LLRPSLALRCSRREQAAPTGQVYPVYRGWEGFDLRNAQRPPDARRPRHPRNLTRDVNPNSTVVATGTVVSSTNAGDSAIVDAVRTTVPRPPCKLAICTGQCRIGRRTSPERSKNPGISSRPSAWRRRISRHGAGGPRTLLCLLNSATSAVSHAFCRLSFPMRCRSHPCLATLMTS
jgi:hypothetical protein